MAFAALSSLMHIIRGHLFSASRTRESLQSALDHASSLEEAIQHCSGLVTEMDEQILIEESRRLEDAIEFLPSTHDDFQLLRQDVDCFAKAAKKMEANMKGSWEQKVGKMIEESIMKLCVPSPPEEEEEEEEEEDDLSMVGLSDQFLQIRDHLLTDDDYVYFLGGSITTWKHGITTWISGMAGTGKTALAKKLFHDPSVKANFDCRVFVRMGGDYVAFENEKIIMEGNIDGSLRRLLKERKFLIVFDDFREDHLPENYCNRTMDDDKGSQILVTSRIDPAIYVNHSLALKMRFLNEEESWELLRKKVFGEEEEDCPRELVKAGKKIAEECEGLPLLIIAVAPILLSQAQKNPEAWKRIAEKPDSVLKEASHQISEVLLSSYHNLSEVTKLCFLYIAAFRKRYVVSVTTMEYLWYAEGFIDSYPNYHMDPLNKNNLVMGCGKGDFQFDDLCCYACKLHCAYWYVSRGVAENNKFLYTMNTLDDGLEERIKGHRRLAIYTNVLLAIKEVHDSMASISTIRSLLCTGPYHPYQVPICLEYWRLLRVLSAFTIRFYEFPTEVAELTCLKYLSLTCNANLPPSISKLCNLQFLFVHQHSSIKRVGVVSYLPVEIWDLQELEVLQIMGRNLPDPPHQGVVLPKLRKLLDVGAESCTKGVLQSLPVLKKLRVQIELGPQAAKTTMITCFDHLCFLHGQLSSFESVVMNPTISQQHPPPPPSFYFINLNNLSLSGFGYPWEDINMVAKLPTLRKLKLKSYAFRGEKWQVEERFWNLRQLYIEDTDLMQWTAEEEANDFPSLKKLVMRNCHKLQKLPQFRKGNYLDIILIDCNPLAETRIKERYRTSSNITVRASYSWKEEK